LSGGTFAEDIDLIIETFDGKPGESWSYRKQFDNPEIVLYALDIARELLRTAYPLLHSLDWALAADTDEKPVLRAVEAMENNVRAFWANSTTGDEK